MMATLKLQFDTSTQSLEAPPVLDGEELLKVAVEREFHWIALDWDGLFQIDLPVEDDVMFLAMAYAELADYVRGTVPHRVVLGDGLLNIVSERQGTRVAMTVCCTPNLDRRFSETKQVEVHLDDYVRAWQRLIHDMLLQLSTDALQ